MRDLLRIGSRGSALALWQSRHVAAALTAAHPGLTCEIEIIKTTGDKLSEASLVAISGKGVFTKEIEDAMLDGRVDLAVHSLKDLPTTLPPGLALAAVGEREDPRDALVARAGIRGIDEIPEGGRVGTSSPRRRSQLHALRPDLELLELRGNVDTRIRKIETERLDAIVLACAGLNRLGYAERIAEAIPVSRMVPAVGQGALGIETRDGDAEVIDLVAVLDHEPTRLCCAAERAFLAGLGGGCAVPIAAHATIEASRLHIVTAIARDDGSVLRLTADGDSSRGAEIGAELARCYVAGDAS